MPPAGSGRDRPLPVPTGGAIPPQAKPARSRHQPSGPTGTAGQSNCSMGSDTTSVNPRATPASSTLTAGCRRSRANRRRVPLAGVRRHQRVAQPTNQGAPRLGPRQQPGATYWAGVDPDAGAFGREHAPGVAPIGGVREQVRQRSITGGVRFRLGQDGQRVRVRLDDTGGGQVTHAKSGQRAPAIRDPAASRCGEPSADLDGQCQHTMGSAVHPMG
jgi:hypothetical protein